MKRTEADSAAQSPSSNSTSPEPTPKRRRTSRDKRYPGKDVVPVEELAQKNMLNPNTMSTEFLTNWVKEARERPQKKLEAEKRKKRRRKSKTMLAASGPLTLLLANIVPTDSRIAQMSENETSILDKILKMVVVFGEAIPTTETCSIVMQIALAWTKQMVYNLQTVSATNTKVMTSKEVNSQQCFEKYRVTMEDFAKFLSPRQAKRLEEAS